MRNKKTPSSLNVKAQPCERTITEKTRGGARGDVSEEEAPLVDRALIVMHSNTVLLWYIASHHNPPHGNETRGGGCCCWTESPLALPCLSPGLAVETRRPLWVLRPGFHLCPFLRLRGFCCNLLLSSMPACEPASLMPTPRFPRCYTAKGWPFSRVANHIDV